MSNVKIKNGGSSETVIESKVEIGAAEMLRISEFIISSLDMTINGKNLFTTVNFEPSRWFLEIVTFYPEKFGDLQYEEFFMDYIRGKYDDFIAALSENPFAAHLNEIIDQKYQIRVRQEENQMNIAITNLINAVTKVVERYSEENLDAGDMKRFIKDFGNFVADNNVETLTSELLKNHRQELSKSGTAKKSTKKTTSKNVE